MGVTYQKRQGLPGVLGFWFPRKDGEYILYLPMWQCWMHISSFHPHGRPRGNFTSSFLGSG